MSQLDDFSQLSIELSRGDEMLGFGGRLVARLIRDIRCGLLTIVLPSGAVVKTAGPEAGPDATIVIKRWRMLRRLVTAGDIGFAGAFIDGDWTTPDLAAVIRLAARNGDALSPAINGNVLMRLVNRVGHLLNANTKKGSRRNIEAHYDLGNDFYKEWLDSKMLYSSAIFDETTPSLETAQQKRLDVIREKLALEGGESVLEIGCGWGALAVELATRANANVVGLTLSPSQLLWAKDAVMAGGKEAQVDLRLQDYRDIEGQFDRIVSIEMFEAVGEAYWPSYFDVLKRCLKDDGRAVLQIISIEEKRFEAYRGSIDFIQKYIFPGGFVPSDSALERAVSAAGLKLTGIEHFGQSYSRTLREWRSRFHAHWPAIAAQGFDGRFRRLWHYYLCYCEAGFEEGCINVGLYTVEHA
ncbi:class I SAM-dependent methyltransferase [Neorhizobium galegae]|uniref:SAM-dependent methyltransferase n=1 Tax=Neorhizobium galegae TaxID=399 RepID=UPI001352FEAF|nr:cyclopropane-fatty-acyl-phospholipid synthase family protein [Neorhizobium galegae]KAB1115122.1 class I SAM-dependent methyltransferase [Neorhizobium galegae]MCQ1774964.1 cyclopropane-fatty-acyl-phospholipid synthase family protein [Neorhizobium galegae]